MPSDQESSPATLEEHLLHPVNLKAAEVLKAGGTITRPNEIALKVRWSPNQAMFIHEQLISWLKTGDTGKLVDLLRQEPTAIARPSVYWQLFHLRQLLRITSEEERADLEAEGYSLDPNEEVLPKGVKPAAYAQLRQLLSAWVVALLPGHTVEPLKPYRRKGRPPKWSIEERIAMLSEFNILRDALNKLEGEGSAELAPKRKETTRAFISRMAHLVQEVNTHTVEYFCSLMAKRPPARLPNNIALTIARRSIQKLRLSKNNLLYGVLAHYWLHDCRQLDTMRGLIEHGEADFSELDRRRRSHSTLALKSKK